MSDHNPSVDTNVGRPRRPVILLVDDDIEFLQLAGRYLADEYEVAFSRNAEEALAYLEWHKPDMILMDLAMPVMDGLTLCRWLKSMSVTESIPVIFITTSNQVEDEIACLDAGGVDFVNKPLNPASFKARIRSKLQLKVQLDELRELSETDGLTGLCNRRHFFKRLDVEYGYARRYKTPMTLLMMDIDHFKAYNDDYGHPAGDACLKALAGTLLTHVNRASDVVARYGGEEFIVLMSGCTEAGMRAKAEAIRADVESLAQRSEGTALKRPITVSIGAYCCLSVVDISQEAMVRHADALLYEAKAAGRNRVCCTVIADKPTTPELSEPAGED